MLPIDNFVSHHKIIVCHEDIIGKRGENVMGMSILPFQIEF